MYYGYRYLNPDTGKWLSRDPAGEIGGLNRYAFIGNHGFNNFDINGKVDWQRVMWGGVQTVSALATFTGGVILAGGAGPFTGGAATGVGIFLAGWSVGNVINGINEISAAVRDKGSPEAIQVKTVMWVYESVSGDPMTENGQKATRVAYYSVDIATACYTINLSFLSMGNKFMYVEKTQYMTGESRFFITKFSNKIDWRAAAISSETPSMLVDGKSILDGVIGVKEQYSEDPSKGPDIDAYNKWQESIQVNYYK